jgi:hypothetical protein
MKQEPSKYPSLGEIESPTSTTGIVVDAHVRAPARSPARAAVSPDAPSRAARAPLACAAVAAVGMIAVSLAWPGTHTSHDVRRASAVAAPARASEALPATRSIAPRPPPTGTLESPPPPSADPASRAGTIMVTVKGHRVFIDGRFAGDGPGMFRVSHGVHKVRVGSEGAIRSVEVPRGGEIVVETTGWQPNEVREVDCPWTPYKEGWACALPASFEQGRLLTPPDFRQSPAARAARQQAWAAATTAPGARSAGRLGVFVPTGEGWLFVPGSSWSPGDPVYLPGTRSARAEDPSLL